MNRFYLGLEKDLKKFKIKNNIESKDIQKVPIELAKEYSNYTFDHNEDLNDESNILIFGFMQLLKI